MQDIFLVPHKNNNPPYMEVIRETDSGILL